MGKGFLCKKCKQRFTSKNKRTKHLCPYGLLEIPSNHIITPSSLPVRALLYASESFHDWKYIPIWNRKYEFMSLYDCRISVNFPHIDIVIKDLETGELAVERRLDSQTLCKKLKKNSEGWEFSIPEILQNMHNHDLGPHFIYLHGEPFLHIKEDHHFLISRLAEFLSPKGYISSAWNSNILFDRYTEIIYIEDNFEVLRELGLPVIENVEDLFNLLRKHGLLDGVQLLRDQDARKYLALMKIDGHQSGYFSINHDFVLVK